MRVYIGHDPREQRAFDVAAKTARSFGCEVIPLYEERLRASGLLTRPVDRREEMWDFNSNAPQSTEFAISRFAALLLAHSGWSLFVDSDTVFMRDPHELERYEDPTKAVCVVKHKAFEPGRTQKMSGQEQTVYPRKFWSSVMMFNADHEANRRFSLTTLNQWPGRDLHAFRWLADGEIGDLPPEANWLVGVQAKPERPMIAHYTLGTPDKEYASREHAVIWQEASER